MFRSNYIGCLTVMYNREKIGIIQIPPDIKKRNDHAIWLKVVKKSDCYLLDENLAFYRKREGSISSTSIVKMLKFHYALYRKSEGESKVISIFHVIENLIYGYLRKKQYTKITGAEL